MINKPLTPRERELCLQHAEMCQVLSHPTRLEIITVLREGEQTVGVIAKLLEIGMGNLSQHLAMMRERRILSSRKAGNQVYYRVANPKLLKACDLLRDILLEQIEKESRLLISKPTTARR
ncbi:MAG: hypothetical protein A2Z27_05545 [candidate division Zixibacteria bacterium RBG_16_50_21]|nr:MAG: hypothetical protein A2Z27_05545 [candidate division Zixibacteria bacterium RBG_16_50_21]